MRGRGRSAQVAWYGETGTSEQVACERTRSGVTMQVGPYVEYEDEGRDQPVSPPLVPAPHEHLDG
jgi:hypothetical protein